MARLSRKKVEYQVSSTAEGPTKDCQTWTIKFLKQMMLQKN